MLPDGARLELLELPACTVRRPSPHARCSLSTHAWSRQWLLRHMLDAALQSYV